MLTLFKFKLIFSSKCYDISFIFVYLQYKMKTK